MRARSARTNRGKRPLLYNKGTFAHSIPYPASNTNLWMASARVPTSLNESLRASSRDYRVALRSTRENVCPLDSSFTSSPFSLSFSLSLSLSLSALLNKPWCRLVRSRTFQKFYKWIDSVREKILKEYINRCTARSLRYRWKIAALRQTVPKRRSTQLGYGYITPTAGSHGRTDRRADVHGTDTCTPPIVRKIAESILWRTPASLTVSFDRTETTARKVLKAFRNFKLFVQFQEKR